MSSCLSILERILKSLNSKYFFFFFFLNELDEDANKWNWEHFEIECEFIDNITEYFLWKSGKYVKNRKKINYDQAENTVIYCEQQILDLKEK